MQCRTIRGTPAHSDDSHSHTHTRTSTFTAQQRTCTTQTHARKRTRSRAFAQTDASASKYPFTDGVGGNSISMRAMACVWASPRFADCVKVCARKQKNAHTAMCSSMLWPPAPLYLREFRQSESGVHHVTGALDVSNMLSNIVQLNA